MSSAHSPSDPERDIETDHGNPFVGPRPFRNVAIDVARFFGRDREARSVRDSWLANRVVVLHGPPSAGKTSLLLAGVLPLLSDEADDPPLVGRLTHRFRPLRGAVPARVGSREETLLSWTVGGRSLAGDLSLSRLLSAHRSSRGEPGEAEEPRRMLVAIDQFEEFFTEFPARGAERERVVDELASALRDDPAIHLLLVVRDDCQAALRAYEDRLSPSPFVFVALPTLSVDAAVEAVRGPFETAGRSFPHNVAEALVDALRTVRYLDQTGESATLRHTNVEPLVLQIVGESLWSALPAGDSPVGIEDLRAAGEIDQTMAGFFDTVVAEVRLETGHSQARLRDWIESTFITEHGTRGMVDSKVIEAGDTPLDVIEALVERRILVAEPRANSTWFCLTHDRLINAIREANRAWRSEDDQSAREPRPAGPAATDLKTAAEAALRRGNLVSARRLAAAAVRRYRENGDERRLAHALALLGQVAQTEGDFDFADECFHAAMSRFVLLEDLSRTAGMLCSLAEVRLARGDYAAAADLFRQAVDRMPADVEALTGLGYAMWYAGSPADAEGVLSQALNTDATAVRALAARGQVRADLREYAAALTDLERALAIGLPPSDEIDARTAHALVLAALGRANEAAPELTLARSRDPERARTHMRAGRVAALLGRSAQARDELQRALRAHPPLPPRDENNVRRLLASLND